jgi:hypothetical protein
VKVVVLWEDLLDNLEEFSLLVLINLLLILYCGFSIWFRGFWRREYLLVEVKLLW